MTRLTNDMRGTIVNALIEHTFDDRVAELVKERSIIALEIYALHYKRDGKRMDDLPDGWLPTAFNIKFVSGGCHNVYNLNGKIGTRYSRTLSFEHLKANHPETTLKRFKHCDVSSGPLMAFDAEHPITRRIENNEALVASLHDEVLTAQKTARATLDRFTTVEKLLVDWPEIQPFIPPVAAPSPSLPALPTQHLNEMFDLPVETDR